MKNTNLIGFFVKHNYLPLQKTKTIILIYLELTEIYNTNFYFNNKVWYY